MRGPTFTTITIISLFLAACGGGGSGGGGGAGGGGGGGGPAPNVPPTADAGPDQSAIEKAEVQLAGSGADTDGGTLSYTWSQIGGPTGSFSSTTAADAMFTVPLIPVGMEEDIVLRLTVSDGQGGSTSDEMTITAASADYIVFMADKDTDGLNELFLYDTQAGAVTKLNDTIVAGGQIIDFAISPDGASIAYRADQDTDEVLELYVAAADGSGATKVSATMANPAGDVTDYQWSPDGTQIVYIADADIDNITEVFLVDRDGANHSKINGSVGAGAVVFLIEPAWSPDGRYIAQMVIQTNTGARIGINTHDTNAGGFNSVRITNVPASGQITVFGWAPDSSAVTYIADQDTDGVDELYSALPDGGGVTKLNGPLVAGGRVMDFKWAPDASRVAYRAMQDNPGIRELYSSLPDGTGNASVNPVPPLTGNVGNYDWSPDSSRIAYSAPQDTGSVPELYASDGDGANNLKLNGPLVAGGGTFVFRWSPDSSRIVYQADQETDQVFEIFRSSADGTVNAKLNGPVVANGQVGFSTTDTFNGWSPDGAQFVYVANLTALGVLDHVVTGDGTNHAQISRTPAGALRTFAKWSADSSSLLYASEQDTSGVIELYIGSADGLSNTRISGTLIQNGDVFINSSTPATFDWSP